MNLNYALPKEAELMLRIELSDEEILYTLPFDINERNTFTEGYFVITPTRFFIIDENKLIAKYSISECSDFNAVDLTSSGYFEFDCLGERVKAVSYSMEHVPRYAYCMRILTELADGLTPHITSSPDNLKCPKCGRSFMRRTTVCPRCTNRIKSYSKIGNLVIKNGHLYLGLFLLFWLNSALMLIQPIINKNIIDKAIIPMSEGTIAPSFKTILFFVLLMALCSLAVTSIGVGRQIVTTIAGSRLSKDLKELVFNKVQLLSVGFTEEQTVGNIMNRISRDTMRLEHFIKNIASSALNELFLFIGVAVVLFLYNPTMALLALIPIPFIVVFCYYMNLRMHKMYRRQWHRLDKLNSYLNDILNGIRVVKAFGQEKRAIDGFVTNAEIVRNLTTKTECFAYTIIPSIKFLMTFGGMLITFYGAKLVLGLELTIGELTQFSTYASYLYNRLEWFSNLPRWISEASNAVERIFEILDQPPEISDGKNSESVDIHGDVEFRHVTFGYKSYKSVLKDINVSVKHGEMIGLVGHSGAGKSTFINLLMRLYDTDEGQILIDGKDIKSLTLANYKSQIGVVLQETFLFSGRIIDNIRYARPDATVEECIAAAKIANAHDFIVGFPNGYDTYVGEKGHRLSGGERQRIAIARAVLSDPRILILDEATASVDTETELLIQQALARLIKGRTTFAIAHRLSTLKNADRLIVLDKGRLAELGSHEELMEKEGIYYSLVKAQQKMSEIKAL